MELLYIWLLASVAQCDAPSDWRPGGRRFNPHQGRQHSFMEIDHEIFSTVILSNPLIQEGQLSVSGERMCTILVNRLEDKAWPVKVWLGKLTALDMTPLGWLGRKTSTQTRRSRVQPPPRSATFFRGDWSWNIFYCHSLPSADSRRAVVSFWQKNVHNTG